ncbi:MAG: hypothetical protein JWO98_4998 [Frankiales bacterium]|nr:hypothetical protein [Frankiales bacterium]
MEVEKERSWWPGIQRAWRLRDDGRGWMADVGFVAQHEWGQGKYVLSVPVGRVQQCPV